MPLGTTSSATIAGIMAVTSQTQLVICSVSDIERMGELIYAEAVGFVMLTPWIGQQMVTARLHERHDLSTVTRLATASAPLAPATSRRLLEMFPNAVLNSAYAQSEAVPAVITNTFDPERPTTLGLPAPGTEVQIVDQDGNALPAGQLGEIWMRSAAPKRRYLDDSRAEVVHDADDWIRTRDLGHRDTEGFLYLFDRPEDVIELNGHLLSSIQIEAQLYEHPAVREAAAVVLPSADLAPALAAFVVLSDAGQLDDVCRFAENRLQPPALPTQWHAVESLPRGVTGKVLKRLLRTTNPVLGGAHSSIGGQVRPL
ncbi:hypothetical protein MSTO_24300 [Mycobacterium stomatepiae]|uniref:Uncharacterized protein n=2 Tax=Mycobacterium stomatepiae TaxID=470076 RepID=A0A7I7Q7A1_9MYCO|nr:hypothetical protein MSTO_24300 [Mycobacterium stomatepiae]